MKSAISKKSLKSAPTTKIEVTAKSESSKELDVRVVRSGVAPSLNGKASLSYQVGRTESNEPQLRIVANSNAGAFCTDWTELKAIRAVLDRAPRNETITSDVLRQLYRGGSANQSGFIFSVLLREGLVRRSTKEKRRYERVEPEVFDAAVKALMDGKGASANADAKGSKAKGRKVVATKPKNDKKSSKLS
jgi:hypothetical protein